MPDLTLKKGDVQIYPQVKWSYKRVNELAILYYILYYIILYSINSYKLKL